MNGKLEGTLKNGKRTLAVHTLDRKEDIYWPLLHDWNSG